MKKGFVLSLALAGSLSASFSASAQEGMIEDVQYAPFTKSLRQRLEHDRADIKQLKFYIDRPLVLRRTNGAMKASIKNGTLVYENGQHNDEIMIPAYTQAICKSMNGDSMTVYFDSPANTFTFGALYSNDNYKMLAASWYGGTADVTYNNQTYQVYCADCGSAANTQLVIQTKGSNNPQQQGTPRIIGKK